jgi:hypothetical protein
MDESKIQHNRREQDENATRERAAILGIQYFDTREVENTLGLVNNVIDADTMHKNRIVPLHLFATLRKNIMTKVKIFNFS